MILIVDTNIIFSGLVKDSLTRKLLIDCPFTLYAPDTLISEIRNNENLILEKSGLTKEEFDILFSLLTETIKIIKKESYINNVKEAQKIIGHIHKEDIPFVALALTIPNDGIWSEDKHFLQQNKIKVFNTQDILKQVS